MSCQRLLVKSNLLPEKQWLKWSVFLGFTDGLGALFYGPRDESADAFSYLFGCLGDKFIRWAVQVAGDAVGETFFRPSTLAAIALLRHTRILLVAKLMLG